MTPTIALTTGVLVVIAIAVSYLVGYWQGCRAGTRIGMAALDNYHKHTMQSLRSLR